MREPLYKTRRIAPAAAEFDTCCARINDFIVLSEGNSNVYLIETPAGGILINSGMGFEAPVHRHNLGKFSDTPIKYLVTTQGHVDHVGGVQYFRDLHPGLVYIAQAGNPEHQEYDARLQAFRSARAAFRFQDDFTTVFERYAAAGYVAINPQDRPTPDVLFEKRHEFSLGGLDVVLIAAPGAETNDSLVVWLPQHRIVFTGNLFGCPFGHFPNLVTIRGDRYRDALTCAAAAQTVLDLEAELLLYGHHEPVAGAAPDPHRAHRLSRCHPPRARRRGEGHERGQGSLHAAERDRPAARVRGGPGLRQAELEHPRHLGELRRLVQARIHHRALQRAAEDDPRGPGAAGGSGSAGAAGRAARPRPASTSRPCTCWTSC